MMGNGLRPDIWLDFKRRFGITRVTEFYGASEGNVAFANLLNKDCTFGMTSSRVALVRYDVDTDEIVRGADGRCIEVEQGEPGLLLGHISPTASFEGYTDREATETKILRDVLEEGDAWFNTGDLIKEVDVGFSLGYAHYQFVDRTGDTFRWKSENVSTNEVGEIVNGFQGVEFCNVYGVEVPGADGRAGMAAVRLAEGCDLDLDGLAAYVARELPPFRAARLRPRADGNRGNRHVQDGQGGPQAGRFRHQRNQRSGLRDEARQHDLRGFGLGLPGDHTKRCRRFLIPRNEVVLPGSANGSTQTIMDQEGEQQQAEQ